MTPRLLVERVVRPVAQRKLVRLPASTHRRLRPRLDRVDLLHRVRLVPVERRDRRARARRCAREQRRARTGGGERGGEEGGHRRE